MHSKRWNIALVIGGLFVLPFVWLSANAHTGATGVVKERMGHMKELAEAMKAIKAGVQAKPDIDRAAIAEAAGAIATHADRTLALFPEGSLKHPSEARPEIWQNWDAFKAANAQMKTEAEKLAEAAKNGDRRAILVQFAKTARSCAGCHEVFRKKSD